MQSPWQDLLANFAIIAIIFSIWTIGEQWTYAWSRRRRDLGFGLLCGLGTTALMLLPFHLSPGVVIDLRSTTIAVSALFGGPFSMAVTAMIAFAFRASLGGTGMWIGFFGITVASTVGITTHYLLRNRIPTTRQIVLFAAAVAFGGSLNFFLVSPSIWGRLIPHVAVPVSGLLFMSASIAAFALAQGKRREEAITQNRLYRALIDALPDGLNAKDTHGRFLAANPATAQLMCRRTVDELIGRADDEFFSEDVTRSFREGEKFMLETQAPVTLEHRMTREDGSTAWLSTLTAPFHDPSGKLVGVVSHIREITEQKLFELQFEENQRRLSDALTHMADALVMFDRNGFLVFSNSHYQLLFPLTADVRIPGMHISDIIRAAVARGEEANVEWEDADTAIARVQGGLGKSSDAQMCLSDGRWLEARTRPTRDGASLIVFTDITRIKEAERRLEEIARTDSLTGLSNRRAFDAALESEIARSRREGTSLSLLMMDLDYFKAFNDTYGHPEGDACLRAVSKCIKQTLRRPADFGARYGGEEFAVILPGTSERGALTVAESFRKAVSNMAIAHEGSPKKFVTATIGVTSCLGDSFPVDSLTLLKRADEALYRAKANGRDCVGHWVEDAVAHATVA